MTRTLSSRTKWILGVVLGLAVVLVGASAGYAAHFSDRALPGVTVAGVSVTGQSQEQVAAAVQQRADATSVRVDVDGIPTTASLGDLGVSVDARATAAAAFAQNASVVDRLRALVSTQDVPIVTTMNDDALTSFTDHLAASAGQDAQDATVTLSDDGTSFQVIPGVEGVGVDASNVADLVAAAASTLTSQQASLETTDVTPSVTTADAQAVADAANALIALDVTLKGTVSVNTATAQDKASWIVFPTEPTGDTGTADANAGATGAITPDPAQSGTSSEGTDTAAEADTDGGGAVSTGLGQPVFDHDKVADWIHRTADSTNDDPVAGVQNVNSRGDVVSTPTQGTPGYTASNTDELVSQALAALTQGQSYTGQITYEKTDPAFDQRLIADGAERQVYQAAPGEKWIDINLSNYTVSAFEGATIVRGPTLMVPGQPGLETVTGTFHVYHKNALQTMRGKNLDGTPYETPNVPWATYFTGDYALHGAPWRSSFGWGGPGGSHGCVNMPVSEAKWIFDWSEIGTTVVSHY